MGVNLKRYPNLPGSPPSVTSLIKAFFPRPALHQWEIEQTAKLARKYPREAIKGILYRHDTGAAARGTRVHKAIECLVGGLPTPMFDEGPEAAMCLEWKKWFETSKLDPLASEVTVWSPERHYAGTVDLMAVDSATGERVLVDWKTCAEVPREAWFDNVVQVCAYMMATHTDQLSMTGPGRLPAPQPAPVHSLGLLVYISPKEVKAFDIQGELLARGRQAWLGTLDIAKALYPELMA